jgi:hypothetical protein
MATPAAEAILAAAITAKEISEYVVVLKGHGFSRAASGAK